MEAADQEREWATVTISTATRSNLSVRPITAQVISSSQRWSSEAGSLHTAPITGTLIRVADYNAML